MIYDVQDLKLYFNITDFVNNTKSWIDILESAYLVSMVVGSFKTNIQKNILYTEIICNSSYLAAAASILTVVIMVLFGLISRLIELYLRHKLSSNKRMNNGYYLYPFLWFCFHGVIWINWYLSKGWNILQVIKNIFIVWADTKKNLRTLLNT